MLSSFDFPGWKFSGQRGDSGGGEAEQARRSSAPPPQAKAADANGDARDWLDDLDELSGSDDDNGSEAARRSAAPALLPRAEARARPPEAVCPPEAVRPAEATTGLASLPRGPAADGWVDDVLFAVLLQARDRDGLSYSLSGLCLCCRLTLLPALAA